MKITVENYEGFIVLGFHRYPDPDEYTEVIEINKDEARQLIEKLKEVVGEG